MYLEWCYEEKRRVCSDPVYVMVNKFMAHLYFFEFWA